MALVDQMIRAAKLDTSLYEEVEADTSQTTNALTVVAISSVCAGIGTAIAAAAAGETGGGGGVIVGLVVGVIGALFAWAVVTACVYAVGSLLGGTATWGEVLRTVGFAYSPGV